MKILGIDPGIYRFAVALVEGERVRSYHVLHPKGTDLGAKLADLYQKFHELLSHWAPNLAAMETVIYHRNVRAALSLGSARGVALLALYQKGIPVKELSPTRVKQALTGSGRASKQQVAFVVRQLLNFHEDVPLDVTDALACALAVQRELKLQQLVGE